MNDADLQELNQMAELTRTDESEKLGQGQSPNMLRFVFLLLLAGAILAGFWYFSGSVKKPAAGPPKERDVPVTVATAVKASVPVEIRSIGNVLPFSVVNIVPQVSGQLRTVHFKQGAHVNKGDLLFQIDPSPYEAALAQAEGNVAKDLANVQQAEATLARDHAQVGQIKANMERDKAQSELAARQNNRYKLLLSQGAVSHEQTDQMATNMAMANATIEADLKQIENAKSLLDADRAAIKTAKGQMQADQAAMRTAQIQLGWTTIRSPIDGKTGSLNVYEGNVVTAQSNQPLVTIAQVKPIYVTFTIPEQHLDKLRHAMRAKTLKLQADIEGVKENGVTGQVSFLENTVNTTTGTVTMRAAFDNEDHRLFPGQFVDVTVSIPAEKDSVVIPSTALQTTQQGTAVYVVKPDKTVKLVPVELERNTGDNAAIGKGLNPGDIVVTDGQLALTAGSKVKIVKGAKNGAD